MWLNRAIRETGYSRPRLTVGYGKGKRSEDVRAGAITATFPDRLYSPREH
jgi:hypothetical protein